MAARSEVEVVLSADSRSLDKAFDNVGKSAMEMAGDLDRAEGKAKSFGGAMDKAADATDASEGKFMGAADLLDGLGGAFGLPTEGATNLMRSFGDLSGGFTAIGPLIGKVGGAFSTLAMGPVGLIIAAVAALAIGIIALYKNSETFREIVTAAFEAVKRVLGPIIDGIGKAIGWVTGLFKSNKEEVEEMPDVYRQQFEDLKQILETNRQKWQDWKDGVTQRIADILNPLQRAREQSKVSFDDINKNLIDNTKFFDGWIANLNVLWNRGFTDLAQKMYELGPTAEKAVGEMVTKSDKELTTMTHRFGLAGDRAQKAFQTPFMTNESLRAIDGAGVEWGTRFKRGFDAGVGPITVPVHRVGPAVPHLAEGGIVRRPTLAVIGESGPEAVVPLSGAGGGGPQVIQLVVDGRVLAEVVRDRLLQKQRTTPLGFAS